MNAIFFSCPDTLMTLAYINIEYLTDAMESNRRKDAEVLKVNVFIF